MMACENTKCNIHNSLVTQYTVGYQLFTLMNAWLTRSSRCCCPALQVLLWHITSPRKDQRSKFKVWFQLNVYCFHTIIKSKNLKSGTICMWKQVSFNIFPSFISQSSSIPLDSLSLEGINYHYCHLLG